MIGLGTIINTFGIIAGGFAGALFGKYIKEDTRSSLGVVCGVSTMFIGVSGAMQGMLSVDGGSIISGQTMLVTLCLILGTLVGELIGIEALFERFGAWLREKTGNAKDRDFVNNL